MPADRAHCTAPPVALLPVSGHDLPVQKAVDRGQRLRAPPATPGTACLLVHWPSPLFPDALALVQPGCRPRVRDVEPDLVTELAGASQQE